MTPPLADEDEELLDGILGVMHYARGYGMTRHFVHLLLVGHHGEENLGCVHHSVIKRAIFEEVEEMLQKVLLPVCLDDSTENMSKQSVLGTNLNEVGKHVECGFDAIAMNRGIRIQAFEIADQCLGNALGNLHIVSTIWLPPLHRSRRWILLSDPP